METPRPSLGTVVASMLSAEFHARHNQIITNVRFREDQRASPRALQATAPKAAGRGHTQNAYQISLGTPQTLDTISLDTEERISLDLEYISIAVNDSQSETHLLYIQEKFLDRAKRSSSAPPATTQRQQRCY